MWPFGSPAGSTPRRSASISGLALVSLVLASCQEAPPDSGYAGTWVLEADQRPLMVLTLQDRGGAIVGSAASPAWSTSDGVRFTEVHGAGISRLVTKASRVGTTLRVDVADPQDNAHPDELELALLDDDHLSLALVGTPFAAWTLTRHRGARPPTIPTDWDPARTYSVAVTSPPTNPEMTAIYDADQNDRHAGQQAFAEQAATVGTRDTERRARTRALLDAGALQAGEDYRRAAFVFQHGSAPADYLLAHTLALVALTKGDAEAGWIAAASLDRYLWSIGKPFVFGTSFTERDGTLIEEEPFDRTVIAEALRRELGVRPVAEFADEYLAYRQSTPTTPKE